MDENLGKGRPVVLSLHGIRTRGKWQKDLTRALNEAGFVHEPLDFGFFHALSLLNPRSRMNRIDWFRDQYTAAIDGLNSRPSIIAHSFGSYLVARTLQKYKQVKFDKVILCGSIVRRDFPWSTIFKREQASEVLHDYGKLDVWASVVGWVASDTGQSGLHGFNDDASGRVVQQCHPEFRHSDYFFKLNYKDNWIPFLNGTHQTEYIDLTPAPPNWRFRIVAAMAAALIIGGASYAWHHFSRDKNIPAPPVEAEIQSGLREVTSVDVDASATQRSDNTATPNPPIQNSPQVNIRSDANCSLQVNGKSAGDLESDVSKLIKLESNEVNIVCTSRDYPTISDSRSLVVRREGMDAVLLLLSGKIKAHEESEKHKAAARQREEIVRVAREKAIQQNLGFEDAGSGTLREVKFGLLWLSKPRVAQGNWEKAASWCNQQGSEWRLPTSIELKRIVHPSRLDESLSTISPLFTRTSFGAKAWSSTKRPNPYGIPNTFVYSVVDLSSAEVTDVTDKGYPFGEYVPVGRESRPVYALTFCVSD